MAGLYGADVDQLRELARQFDVAGNELLRSRKAVANAVQISAWVGPVAVRFRLEWDSAHSKSLLAAAAMLTARAQTLRANADDQEKASGVVTGAMISSDAASPDRNVRSVSEADYRSIIGLVDIAKLGKDLPEDALNILKLVASSPLEYKSFVTWLGENPGTGAVLDMIGLGISADELGKAIGNDDPAAGLQASLDLLMGVVGVKVPLAGPAWELGQMIGAGGYTSLQEIYDSPGSALDFGTNTIFPGMKYSELEPWQRDIIDERYKGGAGLLVSLVDHGGGAITDFFDWVVGRGGRGPKV